MACGFFNCRGAERGRPRQGLRVWRPLPTGRLAALAALSLAVLLLPGVGEVSAQCSMCKTGLLSSPEGRQMAAAFNQGVLFLLSVPFVIGATLAALWGVASRKAQSRAPAAESRHPVEGPITMPDTLAARGEHARELGVGPTVAFLAGLERLLPLVDRKAGHEHTPSRTGEQLGDEHTGIATGGQGAFQTAPCEMRVDQTMGFALGDQQA